MKRIPKDTMSNGTATGPSLMMHDPTVGACTCRSVYPMVNPSALGESLILSFSKVTSTVRVLLVLSM